MNFREWMAKTGRRIRYAFRQKPPGDQAAAQPTESPAATTEAKEPPAQTRRGHVDRKESDGREPKRRDGRGSPQRGKRRVRRYHLGLDWGASATKMVLRDYDYPGDQGIAVVLRPGPGGNTRYTSTVAIASGKLMFGPAAEESLGMVWRSLKAWFALEQRRFDAPDPPPGLTVLDLATLALAHYMRIAHDTADQLAQAVGCDARMGVTVGVPVVELETKIARDRYLLAVRRAYAIAVRAKKDVQGIDIGAAKELIDAADKSVAAADERMPRGHDVASDWLRPELAAGMLWSFRSPRIDIGLYGGVDIGASTTNAVFFRIRSHRIGDELIHKGGLSFYGGACQPPGMDGFDRQLAHALGVPCHDVRGNEERYLRSEPSNRAITGTTDSFFKTYRDAFSTAYRKEARQGAWQQLKVITFGGGSRVEAVRKRFRAPPWQNLRPPETLEDLGCPPDLHELGAAGSDPPQFTDDPVFMLVAYGLALRRGDFPDLHLPDELSDLKPRPKREFVTFEALGYEN